MVDLRREVEYEWIDGSYYDPPRVRDPRRLE